MSDIVEFRALTRARAESAKGERPLLLDMLVAFLVGAGVVFAATVTPVPNPFLLVPGTSVSQQFVVCVQGRPASCVVDGDTIRHKGVVIRVADIDTPEVFSPGCPAEAALGEKATARMVELVNAGPFEIKRAELRDEDRFGRKLRLLARDGRSLGDTLVAEGLAHVWGGPLRTWC